MTKPRKRIVLDSDDESSEIEEMGESLAQEYDQKGDIGNRDHSHAANNDYPVGTRSTSSSEKLRRDLVTAHSNLVDPTPSQRPPGRNEGASTETKPIGIRSTEPADSPLLRMARTDAGKKKLSKTKTSNGDKHTPHIEDLWDVPSSSRSGTPTRSHEEEKGVGIDSQSNASETRPSKKRKIKIATADHNANDRSTQVMVEEQTTPNTDENHRLPAQMDHVSIAEQEKKLVQTVDSPTARMNMDRRQQMEPTVIIPNTRDISRPKGSSATQSLAKRREAEGSKDELGSDEIAIGLPKERYAPRPSRSRGKKHVEHNSQPALSETEIHLPKKSKRRRASETYSSLDKENLVSLGFRSSQAVEALKEANGNVETAAEALFSKNEVAEVYSENEHHIESVDQEAVEQHHEIRDFEMTEGTSRRSTAPKRRRETEMDINDGSVLELTGSKPKKKGRGRPRKSDVTEEKIVDVKADPGEELKAITFESDSKRHDKSVLQEIESNAQHEDATGVKAQVDFSIKLTEDAGAQRRSQSHPPEQNPLEDKVPVVTPKQSSIGSKLNVPLKVGLSKRARIEPLLRIIRK